MKQRAENKVKNNVKSRKLGNLVIKNAAELVTCSGFAAKRGSEMSDLHVIPDGAIVIEDGIIRGAGRTAEIIHNLDGENYEVTDASQVLPGFADFSHPFCFWRLSGRRIFPMPAGKELYGHYGPGWWNSKYSRGNEKSNKGGACSPWQKRLDSMLAFE